MLKTTTSRDPRCLVLIREQLVDGEPCLLGDGLQEAHRRGMNTANDVADGRLANPDRPRKRCLARLRSLEVRIECLHMAGESIGNAYSDAIGHSYPCLPHPSLMAKERSFLDRALEA